MQFAILQIVSTSAEELEIREYTFDLGYALGRALNVYCIGSQIDPHAKAIFQEPEVFVAGPEQGLKIRRDFKRFFHQAEKFPPMGYASRKAQLNCDW